MKSKILSVMIAGGLCLSCLPSVEYNSSVYSLQIIASVKSVTLPKDVLAVGEVKKLVFEWSNGAIPEIIYSSSDERIATVDEEGNVTGISDGTAVITVKTARSTPGEYSINEVEVPVSSTARMSQDYSRGSLQVRQKLCKYDTIYYDKNEKNSNTAYTYITDKSELSNASLMPSNDFKLILPYDAEVIKAGIELIIAPQTDEIRYIYADSLKTGDVVDTSAVLLIYNEYSVNGLNLAVYTPSEYKSYVGDGTVIVKEADHVNKKITFELADESDYETGKCGQNVSYKLGNGVLTVYGSGGTSDYSSSDTPWNNADVKQIIVEKGVTSLRSNIFSDLPNLESVIIADTVTDMGFSVFENDYNLKNITFSKKLQRICKNSFTNCRSLESVILPSGLVKIENEVFSYCTSLKKIVIPSSVESIGRRAFLFCGTGKAEKGSENLFDFEAVTEAGSYVEQYIENINEAITYDSETAVSQARTYEKYDYVLLSLGDKYFREMCFPENYFNALGQETLYLPEIESSCGDIIGVNVASLKERKQEYPGSHAYTYPSYKSEVICTAPEVMKLDEGWYLFRSMGSFSDNVIAVDDSDAYRYIINCTAENNPEISYSERIAVHLTGIISDLNMPLLQADRIIRLKDLTDYTPGDVNGDKTINILDLILMKHMLLSTETEDEIISGAYDYNYDEVFDILDVMELTRYLLGCRNLNIVE